MFFNKKYWLYLSKDEYDLIIHCFIDLNLMAFELIFLR